MNSECNRERRQSKKKIVRNPEIDVVACAAHLSYGFDIPTKLPSFSRDIAHKNAPTSALSK